MRACVGRAELQGLSQRALLHQHPRPRRGHWSALRYSRPALLGVSDPAGLGEWEQRCLSPPRPQTQSPAPHPGHRPGILGLLPPLLDLAAAASVPAGHAADGTGRHAGDGESDPNGANVRKLLCESILLHSIDRKTKTQPADADVRKSALPQEQPAVVVSSLCDTMMCVRAHTCVTRFCVDALWVP